MLRLPSLALYMLLASGASFSQDCDSNAAADRLADALQEVDFVKFYFLTRTGEYSFDSQQFKVESTIRIYRECGANCRRFMKDVITHLSNAVKVVCSPGQQNVLIEIGEIESILYSYSGRTIRFQGKCYFNEEGIDSTIKDVDFIF